MLPRYAGVGETPRGRLQGARRAARVRKKLDFGPHRGVELTTVYGYGYRLEVAEG